MHRSLVAACLAICLATARDAAAELTLGTPFADHMVLQREKPLPVWGWAEPGDQVTVAFAGQQKTAVSGPDGRWLVRLEPLAASAEPAQLTVTAANSGGPLVVADVLVGEVWLGSGQSNMAMQVSRATDFAREQAAADWPLVRMFREDSPAAAEPQTRGKGSWTTCTPDTVGSFSATLFFFGRELHHSLGVPVGLVNSSVGGTPIEAWIADDVQRRSPELAPFLAGLDAEAEAFDREAAAADFAKAEARWRERTRAAREAGKPAPRRPTDPAARHDRNRPGGLFNGKIAPLVPLAIRGIVWYQGEGNTHAEKAAFYRHQLPLLVADWRSRWGEELPFAWVQLPNFDREGDGWMLVREAMLESLRLPRTGMAITIDIGEAKDIHPRNKQDVGRRLAAWALADVYGKPVPARSGPLPAGAEARDGDVVCRFTEAEGLRDRDGGELDGFEVAAADGQWRRARARIAGSTAVVSATGVAAPAGVRYGWAANPKCDLVNAAGLPASPFRAAVSAVAAARRPNVLFIAIDDLRPEALASGNDVIRTPNIDRIAARGTTFDRAYCQQAVCSPSRSSLLTGRRPDATRVWDLDTHFRTALPDAVTIGQLFKSHGSFVQGIGKIFHGGFDDPPSWSTPWQSPKAPPYATPAALAATAANRDSKGRPRGPAFEAADVPDDTYADGKIARLAAATLAELTKRDEPFFLAVGMAKPHLPFVAPKRYWDLYDPERIYVPARQELPEGAPTFAGHSSGELRSYAGIPKEGPVPADLARRLRHGYYAATSYMDAQIGVILDALDREGLADDTVIVVWGDHGWQLGEHGLWHKHTNFELAVRAPLVIAVPGQRAPGRRSLSLAEFVDVYPTLADVCGLPVPQDLDGVSLRPVLDDPAATVREVAISQYPRGPREAGGRSLMGYSIRDDRWRFTAWRDRGDGTIVARELYDERDDPHETVNVAERPEHADVVRRLAAHLPPFVPLTPPVRRKG